MKNSEIRKLVQEYQTIRVKLVKSHDPRLVKKLNEVAQRYYHETGDPINQK
jgi:hypothetical protein